MKLGVGDESKTTCCQRSAPPPLARSDHVLHLSVQGSVGIPLRYSRAIIELVLHGNIELVGHQET